MYCRDRGIELAKIEVVLSSRIARGLSNVQVMVVFRTINAIGGPGSSTFITQGCWLRWYFYARGLTLPTRHQAVELASQGTYVVLQLNVSAGPNKNISDFVRDEHGRAEWSTLASSLMNEHAHPQVGLVSW